jgi:class 3 adenylate cyclase
LHYLVPEFILKNYRHDNRHGRLFAVCLFADISGFSTITDSLMKHGPHGAEILAGLMRSVFDPLIGSVYEHGGFVATFAGDAFTAVFPETDDIESGQHDAAWRATIAAWQIQQRMVDISQQQTPYGDFRVSAKVGLACGDVNWGVVTSEDEQRAAYYFEGPAIDGSAQAEHAAQSGEIIFTPKLIDFIEPLVNAETIARGSDENYRLLGLTASAPPGQPPGHREVDSEMMSRFYPATIVNQEHSGEFRQVLNNMAAC